VTDAEAVEAGPVPAVLAAVTVNVYGVPVVSVLTVQFEDADPLKVQVFPPGLDVAV
jgi:hypothetical protein